MSEFLTTANTLRRQKRYDQALEMVGRHLERDPNSVWGHTLAADCLRCLGKETESREAIGQALSIDPEYAFAHYIHSYILHDDAEKSLAAAQQALRLSPDDADYWARVAEIHLRRENFQEARHVARTGLERDPTHRDCGVWHAYALMSLDRSLTATKVVERLLKLYPDDERVHSVRGWIQLEQQQFGDALHSFAEARRIDPQDRWAEAGMQETLRYFPPVKTTIARTAWSNVQRQAFLAAAYFGAMVLTDDVGWPWWVWLPLGIFEILLTLIVFLYWVAAPMISLLIGLGNGFRYFTKLRRYDLLILGWMALCAIVGWIIVLASLGRSSYQASTVITWSMIPFAAVFTALPGWRRNLTRALAIGYLLLGHVSLYADFEVAWLLAGVLHSISVACLFGAILFQRKAEDELQPEMLDRLNDPRVPVE